MYVTKPKIVRKKAPYHLCAMDVRFEESHVEGIARVLYLQCDMNVKEVSQRVRQPEETIENWIQGGEWNMFRESLSISKKKQLKYLYKALNSVTSRLNATEEPTPKDVELMMRYSAMIKNIDTEHDLTGLIYLAEAFLTWLYKKDEQLSKTVTVEMEAYIKEQKEM